MHEDKKVIIAGFGRVGSTIGRFLQANGVMSTYLDLDPDNVDLLRKLGLKVFYGDASRHDLLHAAGAAEAHLLIVAVDEAEKTREIIATAQKHYPNLQIITRSQSIMDSYELMDMGINRFYLEYLDSSLRMGADALCHLGHRRHESYRALKFYRKKLEQFLPELANMRHNKSQMISEVKQKIKFLEEFMIQEKEDFHKEKDKGWDASDLIQNFEKENTKNN